MEGKMAIHPLFLNYLAKQPFFLSIQQNTIVLEFDIADVEFCLKLDIAKLDISNVEFYVYF